MIPRCKLVHGLSCRQVGARMAELEEGNARLRDLVSDVLLMQECESFWEHFNPQDFWREWCKGAHEALGEERGETKVKRYYCDRCNSHIDLDSDGFAQMRVSWWSRGGRDRMEYRPDPIHRDGNEEFMICARCANEVFGELEGMERA